MTDGSWQTSKAEARRVLRRVGYSDDVIDEMLEQLPDPIDLNRAGAMMTKYGVSLDRLISDMGGSP